MKKVKIFWGLFFLFSVFQNWSQGYHQNLLNIISEDNSVEIRQHKIDSFFDHITSKKIPPKVLADCYHDLGSKWYFKKWWRSRNKEDLTNAISVTYRSFEIKDKILQDSLEKGSLEKTLYNLGYFNSRNDNPYESIRMYKVLINKGKDKRKILSGHRELGKQYRYTGDFYKALEQLGKFCAFYEKKRVLEKKERRNLSDVYILRAEIYALMGYKEFESNIQYHLSKADSLLQKEPKINVVLKNSIHQIEGNTLLKTGRYKEAIKSYEQILKDSSNLRSGNLARVYNSIGLCQFKKADFENALSNLRKSISYDNNYSDPYNNLGDLYVAKKEFNKALFNYQKAIIYEIDKTKNIQFDETPIREEVELSSNKISLLNHLVTKANGWIQYYEYDDDISHLNHALKTFKIADQLVDVIRHESTEHQSKLFWREQGAKLYMQAVKTCYLLRKPEEAYYFMERNKALLLLENVTREQAKEISKLPDEIAKQEFKLKRSILLAENTLQNNLERSKDTLAILKDDIYNHKRKYNQFVDSLTIAFPEYAALKKRVEILPYPSIKEKYISQDETILQYILNKDSGYAILNTSEGPLFYELENTEKLNASIIELYERLSSLISNAKEMKSLAKVSNQVFKTLIPQEIYDNIKEKKLTIIPDYTLQQIPFETLVVDPEHTKYLIEDTEIRYAYSMSYLDSKERMKNTPNKDYLGVAPIQFETLGLKTLHFSQAEIDEVQAIYSGTILQGDEAKKNEWIDRMKDYKIIHLSTHADIDESGNHWIAFNNDKVYLNEIYASKNQADMVVLSACNTSLGELKKGEGVMSLARGFFHTGAKSVVSSLWSISDKTSKDLIVDFFKGINKGLTKSAALREAKLAYLNKYGNSIPPSYWGGLIVIGDNTPIKTSNFIYNYETWIVFGVILILITILFLRKKANP